MVGREAWLTGPHTSQLQLLFSNGHLWRAVRISPSLPAACCLATPLSSSAAPFPPAHGWLRSHGGTGEVGLGTPRSPSSPLPSALPWPSCSTAACLRGSPRWKAAYSVICPPPARRVPRSRLLSRPEAVSSFLPLGDPAGLRAAAGGSPAQPLRGPQAWQPGASPPRSRALPSPTGAAGAERGQSAGSCPGTAARSKSQRNPPASPRWVPTQPCPASLPDPESPLPLPSVLCYY